MDGWESPVRKVILYAFAGVEDRVRIAAYNRSVYNLAFAVGSLLAALALAGQQNRLSLYLVVIGNAVSFLFAAALAARLPPDRAAATAVGGPVVRSSRYALVGLLCGCLFLCTSILTIGIPLLILRNYHSQQWLIGLAMFVNTVVAVTLQIRLSRGSADIGGATRAGVVGGLTLALACVLFFATDRVPSAVGIAVLLIAVIALSVGELYASAATWGLSMSLRSHDLTAHNQSVWSMYNSLPHLLGPFIVASSLNELHAYGWLVMGAFIALAALVLKPVAVLANRRIREGSAADAQQLPVF